MLRRAPLYVFYDERVLAHDTGAGLFESGPSELLAAPELHPENAERLRNMLSVLERGPLAESLVWRPGRLATDGELETVHDPAYVEEVRAACAAGGARLTRTTPLAADSWEPIRAAAGTSLAAADAVLGGETRIAFALVRPPGHHAQPAQADGYCFFNNTALAAERARAAGVARVAVVDWDVHHGNGTQACFWESVRRAHRLAAHGARALGTLASADRSTGRGRPGRRRGLQRERRAAGRIGRSGLRRRPGGGGRAGRARVPAGAPDRRLRAGRELLDPNGRQNVTMAGFRRIGSSIAELADELCEGRLVLVQEGGYARTYAAFCLHATLEGVLGAEEPLLPDPLAYVPDDAARGREALVAARSELGRFWAFGAP